MFSLFLEKTWPIFFKCGISYLQGQRNIICSLWTLALQVSQKKNNYPTGIRLHSGHRKSRSHMLARQICFVSPFSLLKIDCKRRHAKIYITSLFGTKHMQLQAKYNAPYFSFSIKQVQRTNSNVKLSSRRTSLILTIIHSIQRPVTGPKLPKNPFIKIVFSKFIFY